MKNNLIFFVLLAAILVIASCSTTGSRRATNPFGAKPSCSTTDFRDKSSCGATTGKGAKRIADPAGDKPSWDDSSKVGKQ